MQTANPGSSRGRLNSNLLQSVWLPGVEPGARFDSQQLQCKDLTLPREVGMFVLFPGLTWKGTLPSTLPLEMKIPNDGIPTFFPLGRHLVTQKQKKTGKHEGI